MSPLPAEVDEPDPREEPGRVDEFLRPFLTDSMLWPVALVCVLSIASFGAYLLVRAFERNVFAMAALLGVAWMSYDAARDSLRAGRPAVVALLVLTLWLVATAGAVAGVCTGIL